MGRPERRPRGAAPYRPMRQGEPDPITQVLRETCVMGSAFSVVSYGSTVPLVTLIIYVIKMHSDRLRKHL